MRSPGLTPLILFLSAAALPACQLGEFGTEASQEKLVAPPASCQNGDPTCNTALDYPNATELQMAIDSSNAAGLAFSSADNALLVAGSDTFFFLDSDADGVPDPADDCPGRAGGRRATGTRAMMGSTSRSITTARAR